MAALNNSSNIPSVPALWTEFRQNLCDTDSETLDCALNILRQSTKNPNPLALNNINLSMSSSSQREKIEKIISPILRMEDDLDAQAFVLNSGYSDEKELAQALIEQKLWDASELTVSFDQLHLLSFFTEKSSFPSPLPDVIGTQDKPGELNVKIQEHLQELREQGETLQMRSEEESDPTEKRKLIQELADVSASLQERTQAWEKVKTCIREAPALELFPRELSKRQEAYQRFAYRLNIGFDSLKSRGLELHFFAKEGGIADLPEVCFTGWHNRIETMIEGSENKQGIMQKVHLFTRDLRRSIMQEQVLTEALRYLGYREHDITRFSMDVHYRQAVKQWANERFALGYSQDELGAHEETKVFLADSFHAVTQEIMKKEYSPQALAKMLIDDFRRMNRDEQETLLGEILTQYRQDCRQDPTLLLDPLDNEKVLYEEMERANNLEETQERINALCQVRQMFIQEGIKPPFSLATPYKALERELKTKYPRPAFVKVFQSFQNASETDRVDALQKAYQDLKPEQKDAGLEALLARMQASLSPKVQEEHLHRQKKEIADRAHSFEDFCIDKNVRLLERKLIDGKELSEFGAHLCLCSAKLLSPNNTTNARADKPAKILQWAHEQYPSVPSEQVLQKLQEDPSIYHQLPKNLQDLTEVREYVQQNPWVELGAPSLEEYEHYRSLDPQTINLESAPLWVRGYKQVVLAAVSQDGWALKHTSERLKNDREVVLAAVSQDGRALQFASEELKNDREIVLAAVSQYVWALEHTSGSLKNDREVILAAVSKNGYTLEYASDELKNDREVVLVAISKDGFALEYASEQLKNDREVVLAAVSQNGCALQYANEQLKNNREIVLAAVSKDGFALEYASEQLKDDREIVLAAVSKDAGALQYANEQLKNNREIVLAAVSKDAGALQLASEQLRKSHTFRLSVLWNSIWK